MKPIPFLLLASGPLASIATGAAIWWDLTWLGTAGLFYSGLALAEVGYLLMAITRLDHTPARDPHETALLTPEA